MKKKLEKLVEKYGLLKLSLVFGYSDTGAIKKWLDRGVPELKKDLIEDILALSDSEMKALIIRKTKRGLC